MKLLNCFKSFFKIVGRLLFFLVLPFWAKNCKGERLINDCVDYIKYFMLFNVIGFFFTNYSTLFNIALQIPSWLLTMLSYWYLITGIFLPLIMLIYNTMKFFLDMNQNY